MQAIHVSPGDDKRDYPVFIAHRLTASAAALRTVAQAGKLATQLGEMAKSKAGASDSVGIVVNA